MSAATKLVAVTGATGKQGGATLAALLKLGGVHVRALTRNPDSPSSAKLAQPGVEVVKADYEDFQGLVEAFEGCDAVFAVTDFWVACGGDPEREKKQGMNLVDAAKKAGVSHFVFSSLEDTRPALAATRKPLSGNYTVPHFDAKSEVDAYMRQQLPGACTSILPSVFYENLLPGGGMEPNKQPDGSYALFAPTGETNLSWCATADIGGVAAAAIVGGPERYGGKALGVAGEHATLAEVADMFSRVFGKKVVAATPPADDWAAAVQGFGVPQPVAEDMANMFLFYTAVDMRQPRPLEQAREMWPDVQGLEAWMVAHKDQLETLFA